MLTFFLTASHTGAHIKPSSMRSRRSRPRRRQRARRRRQPRRRSGLILPLMLSVGCSPTTAPGKAQKQFPTIGISDDGPAGHSEPLIDFGKASAMFFG